ncbi:hypothetical protein [Candidatus Chloroploca sp. Khr17]|uniref:hypothetical protein n=1 Tax=Candidatus Chloroploca sp. Khr17 TaxID=2496869 RepID=UPI00101DEDA8|nr:hypothetical protein [Candidatus Chloroploca sp. Khr17]
MSDAIALNSDALVPAAWQCSDDLAYLRVYNPSLTRFRNRLLMAYRVDSGRRRTMQRRIALCALDDDRSVIPGSVVPLSDTIHGGDPRHYDPRFLVYRDRLFVHYNNNVLTRPNQIHLVELDPDTLEARGQARPLHLDGPRQEVEKNWMLFDPARGLPDRPTHYPAGRPRWAGGDCMSTKPCHCLGCVYLRQPVRHTLRWCAAHPPG